MNNDLKIIKKLYGEEMMHFCRDYFSSILEEKGLLPRLLQDIFAPSHMLYEDLSKSGLLDKFKNYIYDLFYKKDNEKCRLNVSIPQELMRQAGYILYECRSEEEIQVFKKYYAKGEALCTFNGGRLNSCYVFFAIKENVDDIKREDFSAPERQDLYGTSVISIQFAKNSSNTLSIKNRYNHLVSNPDATFGNNLDNIISGLTESFENTYGLRQKNISTDFELLGYVLASDGKWYKYNFEMNNIYYCPNNIIIDNFKVKHYEKEKYIVIDNFIIDLKDKKIQLYDQNLVDDLPDVVREIKKIIVSKNSEGKEITIINEKKEKIVILIDKNSQIIGFISNDIKTIRNNFLCCVRNLKILELPSLQQVGDNFLYNNNSLSNLSLPELKQAGHCFLSAECFLESIELPKFSKVADSFLYTNRRLKEIYLPVLQQAGDNFLYYNQSLKRLEMPELCQAGNNFLAYNNFFDNLYLPKLEQVGYSFLYCNRSLKNLSLPNLRYIGRDFLYCNAKINKLELPLLERIESGFLYYNKILIIIDLPNLQEASADILASNIPLKETVLKLVKEKMSRR